MSLKVGNVGDKVVIEKSSDLTSIGLGGLVGKCGHIIEARVSDDIRVGNRGYWVKLSDGDFEGHRVWFIPRISVKILENKVKCQATKVEIETVYDDKSGVAHIITK